MGAMHRWLPVLLIVSGCAFGLSAPDPDRPRSERPKCDTGKGLILLDGLMAATAGVVAISLAGETEPAVALLPLSVGAIYAGGAMRGASNVNKCRKAMAEYESYVAAHETLPPGADYAAPPRRPPIGPPIGTPIAEQGLEHAVEPGAQPQPQQALAPMVAAPPPPIAAPAQPPPVKPAAKAPPAKPQPPPPPKDDEWADFWREVE